MTWMEATCLVGLALWAVLAVWTLVSHRKHSKQQFPGRRF